MNVPLDFRALFENSSKLCDAPNSARKHLYAAVSCSPLLTNFLANATSKAVDVGGKSATQR